MSTVITQITEKLAQLPPERIAEIVDFVDFIAEREHERDLLRAAQSASATTLGAIWNNDADAAHDQL